MGVQIGRNKGGDSCPEGVIGTEVAMSGVGNDLISQTTDPGDSENAVASIGVRLPKREQSPSHKRSTPANHGNRLENHLGQCARQGRRLTVWPSPGVGRPALLGHDAQPVLQQAQQLRLPDDTVQLEGLAAVAPLAWGCGGLAAFLKADRRRRQTTDNLKTDACHRRFLSLTNCGKCHSTIFMQKKAEEDFETFLGEAPQPTRPAP